MQKVRVLVYGSVFIVRKTVSVCEMLTSFRKRKRFGVVLILKKNVSLIYEDILNKVLIIKKYDTDRMNCSLGINLTRGVCSVFDLFWFAALKPAALQPGTAKWEMNEYEQ